MPEVKVIHPVWIGGKPRKVDAVLPLSESDANYLVSIGRVEKIVAPKKSGKAETPAKTEKQEKAD